LCGPKKTRITWGQGRTNPFAEARGDKTVMRPSTKILNLYLYICQTIKQQVSSQFLKDTTALRDRQINELVDRLDRVSCKYNLLINDDKMKVMASDGTACRILIQNELWSSWIRSNTLGPGLKKMVSVQWNSVPG